jgi:hypothetical protein
MPLLTRSVIALLPLLAMIAATPLHAATRIELVIDELRENRSVAWPVTTGVPFPEGKLTAAEQCRLVDDRGEEQLLQSKVAATWDAEKKSIRWLTIDFIAQPGRKYVLEFGPEISRKAMPSPLQTNSGDVTTVATGSLSVSFLRQGPAALGTIRVDLNGDGQIDNSETIASGAMTGEHTYLNQRAQRFTSADDGEARDIILETTGPVRSCVRVDGWYTGPGGERIVKYRTRYHFYAGLSVMKVIDEFRIVDSTRETQFADIALPLHVNLNPQRRRVTIATSAGLDEPNVTVDWQSNTQFVSSVQLTYRHYGNLECRSEVVTKDATGEQIVRSGERTGPWLQLSDDRTAITGSLRWMWQQFPKQWEATSDQLVMHLWSPRVEPLDFGADGLRKFFGPAGEKYLTHRVDGKTGGSPIENFFFFAGQAAVKRGEADGRGINKHHELWYHFGRAADVKQGQEYGDLADRQPLCLATGAWNVSTGVFGPLAARPNDSPHEAIVDQIFELERYAQDTFGDYGWWLFGAGPHYSYHWDATTQRHYADSRRFEYHTYQRETQLWWCYLRSGERKFYDWAIPAENHWVDVAVTHVPTKFSTDWRGGIAGNAVLHYPAGDWSIDSPLHYVRHHDTGEAWLRSALQFWGSYHRTLETTTLAYYLTGDDRYQDVIDFWREFWSPLAGVKSDTATVTPLYREQLWFKPTKPGEPAKTWAQMIRDYAPFQSGSRHQMTLFFNLSTLYEHTWDAKVAQVVREFADAYLDPGAPNGVWQCHDHHLPANSDCPLLSHYWSSALWKYDRATHDPRMKEVLPKYFRACLEADPYGADVGIYSNVQIAWAWHFLSDPRALTAARHELNDLMPFSLPLEKPEQLGERIYNPYAPIKALTATPRLIAVLDEAKRLGVAEPQTPPLEPQRTLLAVQRTNDKPLRLVTWGWDDELSLVDAQGHASGTIAERLTHRSFRQPFDRRLPGHQVFRTTFAAPATSAAGWNFLVPRVETGVIELTGGDAIWCWLGEPIKIEPGHPWYWRRSASVRELVLEAAQVGRVSVSHQGKPLVGKIVKNTATFALDDLPADAVVQIEPRGGQFLWCRMTNGEPSDRWVSATVPTSNPPPFPISLLSRVQRPAIDPQTTFVPGKFGQGLLLTSGRELTIPDETTSAEGSSQRLTNPQQGTIEFWIRRQWDERTTVVNSVTLMTNGQQQVYIPGNLPLDEWSHVAIVWRPVEGLTDRVLVHIYINGCDHGNYRNLIWAGYAPPPTFSLTKEWLRQFVARPTPGVSYVLDDLRVSSTARYADLKLLFGREQAYNPVEFAPPTSAHVRDESTLLYLSFDGDTRGTLSSGQAFEAKLRK